MTEKRHYCIDGEVVVYEPQFGKHERMQIGRDSGDLGQTWQSLIAGEDFGTDRFNNRFTHTDHVEIVYNPENGLVDSVSLRKLSEPKLHKTLSRGEVLHEIDSESLERILNDAKDVFLKIKSKFPNSEYRLVKPEAEIIRKYINQFGV